MGIPRIMPAGTHALVAEFGNTIDEKINDQVQALAARIAKKCVPGVTELVPTFRSLLIHYDPDMVSFDALCGTVRELSAGSPGSPDTPKRLLIIPCCYGSHFGPDLPELERRTGFSREEIIARHSGVDYRVYMLGFLPGFVYLGGLDPALAAPRLATPRTKIPEGAVGIGGNQTGVYPVESPGGWRLIGSTPVRFYDPDREEPVLCRAGDAIRFVPISSSEYYDIRQEILHGRYRPAITEKDPQAAEPPRE